MAPKPWASPEQQEFLQSLLDEFLESQKTHKLMLFWPKVQNAWFQQWKEPGMDLDPIPSDVIEKIEMRKKQITTWFYNNRKESCGGKAHATLLKLGLKPRRTLTPVQLYSTENYENKIKPAVQTEIKENNVPKDQAIEIIKRRTAESFFAEPIEVQQSFIERSTKLKEERIREKHASPTPAVPTPASYADEIKKLPKTLNALVTDLSTRTGWSFLILTGGPDPSNGGKIRTACMHEGRNTLGHTFANCHPSFEDDYIKPFANFLKQVYPPSVRQERSLQAKDNGAGYTSAREAHEVMTVPVTFPAVSSTSSTPITHPIPMTPSECRDEIEGVGGLLRGVNTVNSLNNLDSSKSGNTEIGGSTNFPGIEVDDQSWLDPVLRSSSTIVNDAALTINESLTHLEDGQVTSEVPDYPSEIHSLQLEESNERSRRQRRPAASKEVVPVTSRDKSWLCDSHTCLAENDYGPMWSSCITLWLTFEQSLPLADISSARLPAIKIRPRELSQWLAKRDHASPPVVQDTSQYTTNMTEWWTAMKASTKKKSQPFEHLRKGGPNGIVTLLLGLKLWRMNIDIEKEAEWKVIVAEVDMMLNSFSSNGTKRKEAPVTDSSITHKRQK